MAIVNEVVVSRSVKVNLGDYESIDLFTSMKGEIEPGEDEAEAYKGLVKAVERSMVMQILAHYKARGRNADKNFVIKRYGFGGVK